jgi:hypothetical protein
MKTRKYIKFHNKRIKPYIISMGIQKNDKIAKASKENIRVGPQTSLRNKSRGAKVL